MKKIKIGKIFNLKNLNRFLLVFIIFLGLFYLAGTNDLAIRGYTLSELKEQRNKIADENKKLELQVTSFSSLNSVNEKIAGLKMVAVGEINYIEAGVEVVAVK